MAQKKKRKLPSAFVGARPCCGALIMAGYFWAGRVRVPHAAGCRRG